MISFEIQSAPGVVADGVAEEVQVSVGSPAVVQIEIQTGVQGQPGVDSDSIRSIIDSSFSYGDAPQPILSAIQNCRVVGCDLVIRAAFNGSSPSILIGTSADPDVIFGVGDCDPKTLGVYEQRCDVSLSTGQTILLSIDPGGSTVGNGVITLYVSYE